MDLVDWCATEPALVAGSEVQSPAGSYYYQPSEVATFEWNRFTSDMPFTECPLQVSCSTSVSVNGEDFCSLGSFNPDQGGLVQYDFSLSDNVNLGTQTVTMIITATQAAKTVEITFTLELVDPCLTTAISIDSSIMADPTLYKIYTGNSPQQVVFDLDKISYLPETLGQLCTVMPVLGLVR